ncbi:MAG: 2-phospho-L-lactate guanylyltransferase [Thaumarchaeota archaeon]|nr:2-phospho-L-lactate guanylyltransferase [Nitrososphaerota archaeon]
MKLFTVIPVKKLDNGKTRLSPLLSKDERKELSLRMLHDVLKTISLTHAVSECVIISSDQDALNTAKTVGFTPLREPSPMGINEAIQYANSFCIDHGAASTLVLPADIPLITQEDINNMVDASKPEPSVIIIPSARQDGTNALLRRPPKIIATSYDRASYPTHLCYASDKQVRFTVLHPETVMLDLDLPQDLDTFMKRRSNTATYSYLSSLKPALSERHLCHNTSSGRSGSI